MTKEIRIPAEWEEHRALWTCWPAAHDLWESDIEPARAEMAAMINSLITPHEGKADKVKLLVASDEAYDNVKESLPKEVELVRIPYGDIWLRDTGPIFAKKDGKDIALCFGFNGWGGKYILEHDDKVNYALAKAAGIGTDDVDFVLEGGSIDTNGQGIFLTTTQCLLNQNRNPKFTKEDIEIIFAERLGMKKMIWLEDGLMNDHTDGHIDNIARFIGENTIICQAPFGDDDPNAAVLDKIYNDLCAAQNLEGKPFEVVRAPSPGKVLNYDGDIVPASHMNFIIGNGAVVMPHYGSASTDEALRILAKYFPNHKVCGIEAAAILTGGGSFHCITQQEPL